MRYLVFRFYGIGMNKKNSKDHLSIKEVCQGLKVVISDYLLLLKEWLIDYGKVFLPLLLLILVGITVFVSVNARDKVEAAAREAVSVLEETTEEVNEIKDISFEVDANVELNYLFVTYYEALTMNDIDTLIDLQSNLTQTESIRLEKMCEYIEKYDNIHVYSKPGPFDETYIAYVYSDVYLKDCETATPGLQAFYVCTNESGNLYINNGELSEQEALYIKNISEQGDVVDLKNQVNVNFSSLLEENGDLNQYWADTSVAIDVAVGNQLSSEAMLTAQLEESTNPTPEDTENPEGEEEVVVEEPKVIKVVTNASVNVRKSASATADKVGSAKTGEVFVVIEQMSNGWTKLNYEGQEAFILSKYLDEMENIDDYESVGIVVATSSVNVRAAADTSGKKLGILQQGEMADLIEVLDGWCKIKFNGVIGYVSSDYVALK